MKHFLTNFHVFVSLFLLKVAGMFWFNIFIFVLLTWISLIVLKSPFNLTYTTYVRHYAQVKWIDSNAEPKGWRIWFLRYLKLVLTKNSALFSVFACRVEHYSVRIDAFWGFPLRLRSHENYVNPNFLRMRTNYYRWHEIASGMFYSFSRLDVMKRKERTG